MFYSGGVFQSSHSFSDWTWRVTLKSIPKWRQPRREAGQRVAAESRFSKLTRSIGFLADACLWTLPRRPFVRFSEWSWARLKWLWVWALLWIFLSVERFFQCHTQSWWSDCRLSWNLSASWGTDSAILPNFCLKLGLPWFIWGFHFLFWLCSRVSQIFFSP